MRGLTAKQQRLLDYVTAYMAEHGYQPPVAKMMAHMGAGDSSQVRAGLKALAQKGRIRFKRERTRAGLTRGRPSPCFEVVTWDEQVDALAAALGPVPSQSETENESMRTAAVSNDSDSSCCADSAGLIFCPGQRECN
jgi:SOS-response transcriptional repressor LexA